MIIAHQQSEDFRPGSSLISLGNSEGGDVVDNMMSGCFGYLCLHSSLQRNYSWLVSLKTSFAQAVQSPSKLDYMTQNCPVMQFGTFPLH